MVWRQKEKALKMNAFDAKYNYAWKWEIYDFMVQMWYKCAVFNNKQPQENHYKNKDKDSFWYAYLFLP